MMADTSITELALTKVDDGGLVMFYEGKAPPLDLTPAERAAIDEGGSFLVLVIREMAARFAEEHRGD